LAGKENGMVRKREIRPYAPAKAGKVGGSDKPRGGVGYKGNEGSGDFTLRN